MALWTKTDSADTADTIVNIDTVSGSKTITTASTTSIKNDDKLTGTGVPANSTVQHVVDATHFTINRAATGTATVSGTFVHRNTAKPKSQTVVDQKLTFGVDVNEIMLKPYTHAGWVKAVAGTGGRSGRTSYETIVAMGSISGDASDDATYADPTLSITGQPTALTAVVYTAVNSTSPISLGATVTAIGSGLNTHYQWTVSDAAAGTYTNVLNVAGNSGIAGATTNTLVLKSKAQNTKFYKLAATAGTLSALSNAAKVAGGVATASGTWSTPNATIVAAGHGLITGDYIVVTGVTPPQYNVSNIAVTVSGNNLTYACADPSGAVTVQGIVYKYVA